MNRSFTINFVSKLNLMLAYLILTYFLIKFAFGTDKIDAFFLSIGKLLLNKKHISFETAEYFNTPALRAKWWNTLDEEWNLIFKNQTFNAELPLTDGTLEALFKCDALLLDLNSINNLNGLKHLTNLQHVVIYNYAATDLSDLKHLHKLQKLEFINCDFSSIVPITPIKQVVDLRFENCQIDTLDSFQYLKNLKRLQLERNCITDLRPIKKASQLEFLSLQNNPIKNFDALAHLPNTKIELSIDQKYDLKKLQDKNINVDIAFTNTYYNYDETFFQNN